MKHTIMTRLLCLLCCGALLLAMAACETQRDEMPEEGSTQAPTSEPEESTAPPVTQTPEPVTQTPGLVPVCSVARSADQTTAYVDAFCWDVEKCTFSFEKELLSATSDEPPVPYPSPLRWSGGDRLVLESLPAGLTLAEGVDCAELPAKFFGSDCTADNLFCSFDAFAWQDAEGELHRYNISDLPVPPDLDSTESLTNGSVIHCTKEGDVFHLFFLRYVPLPSDSGMAVEETEIRYLRYDSLSPENSRWQKWTMPESYTSRISVSLSPRTTCFVDGVLYFPAYDSVIALDTATGESYDLSEVTDPVLAQFPECSQSSFVTTMAFSLRGVWGDYFFITVPLYPTSPEDNTEHDFLLALRRDTCRIAGALDLRMNFGSGSVVPSEVYVDVYDENLTLMNTYSDLPHAMISISPANEPAQ